MDADPLSRKNKIQCSHSLFLRYSEFSELIIT